MNEESNVNSITRKIAYYESVFTELDNNCMDLNEKRYIMNMCLILYDELRDA